jgi:thioredoxin-related protein
MRLNFRPVAATVSVLVLLCTIATRPLQGQRRVLPAQILVERAVRVASAEDKTVFIHFGASWCKWCKQLNAMLRSSELKQIIGSHFVVISLTVQESESKKSVENPGAETLMTESGGKTGVPYYLFLNKDGARIANSMVLPNHANIGYPATAEEIKAFEDLMGRVAPRMSVAERARIVDYLTKHAPKDADTATN